MPKQNNAFLTKQEMKNPIGTIANGISDRRIVEKLKEVDFLTDKVELTRRGKEYVIGKLSEMDSVERILLERFILEHHGIEKEIEYDEK